MRLEELVESGLINKIEYEVYSLFELSELGRNWYQRMLSDTFMDCVPPPMFSSEIFAYTDGRRSIIRDIKMTTEKINKLLEGKYEQ